MSMESTQGFVKRMYGDEEFMKDLFRNGVLVGTGNKNEDPAIQTQKFVETAPEFGYEFTAEEYDAANDVYVKTLGAKNGFKLIWRMMKIGKAVEKEQKKANKKK